VDSVLLFIRDLEGGGRPLTGRRPSTILDSRDLDALHGARIALTEESSTSVRLLRLLLEVRYGLRPIAYERQTLYNYGVSDEKRIDQRFAAALVIGDQALRWRVRPPDGFVQAMDLACEWCDWTAQPFVFACWCVRCDLDPERAAWLGQFLVAALDEAGQDLSRLTHGLPAELGPTAVLTEYLRNFIYRLGPGELASMARFRALLEASRIECSAE
jgi:chorismate dehydratase